MDKLSSKTQTKIDEDSTGTDNEEYECETNFAVTKITQKKSSFKKKTHLRHFPQIQNDQVMKRYSCALVSDFLRQGYLYITDQYFVFYSNIFGYVTKLIIPVLSIEEITKEKTAKIIPNAVGIQTREQKHVFASFLQRDNSYTFLRKTWLDAKKDIDEIYDSENSETSTSYDYEGDLYEEGYVDSKSKTLSDNIKETKRRSRKHIFVTLTMIAIILIIVLIASSGTLLYQILKMQSKFSSISTIDGINTLKTNPAWNSKSYIAVSDFVDKNIHVVSDVRKSLESLSKVLTNENSSKKDL